MAAATADPLGYFVGRPLHYQGQQPQTVPPAAAAVAAPAVDEQNAVNAQVPGYYRGRVQPRGEDTEHNNTNSNAGAADQQNREQSFFAKWFAGCFFSGSN